MSRETLVPVEHIRRSILRLRGHNVMVDEDLATLYQVDVKVLNQAVKRHRDRFPADFMFKPSEPYLPRTSCTARM